jgi:hypothetical protein
MSGEPRPRCTRNQDTRWDTQDDAWDAIQPRQGTICAEVLDIIKAGPRTCDEIEQVLRGAHQTVSPAVNALMRDGLIRAIGKRPTRSGRQANVWQAVLPHERQSQPTAQPEPQDGSLFAEPAPQKGYRY